MFAFVCLAVVPLGRWSLGPLDLPTYPLVKASFIAKATSIGECAQAESTDFPEICYLAEAKAF